MAKPFRLPSLVSPVVVSLHNVLEIHIRRRVVRVYAATFRADNALLLSDFTPFASAALLVGEILHEFYQVHGQYLLRRKCTKKTGAMYDNQ